MSKKKILIIITIFIIIFGVAVYIVLNNSNKIDSSKNSNSVSSKDNNDDKKFLLDQYPIKEIPLYKNTKVESNKFFYNTDPGNTSAFGDALFSYFNVVFETTATKSELFEYYRGIFDSEVKEEFSNNDSIKGIIGKYKVQVSQYSDDTAYIQAYLKSDDKKLRDEIFLNFPFIKIDLPYVKLDEQSYGLLNQKGGEIEYTHYYTVSNTDINKVDGIDEFAVIGNYLKEYYKNYDSFSFEGEDISWRKDSVTISIVLSTDHGRVYVQYRKPMSGTRK